MMKSRNYLKNQNVILDKNLSNIHKGKRALLETLELKSVKFLFAMGSLLSFVFLIIQSCVVSPQPQSSYTPEELAFNEKFNVYWMYTQLGINGFLLIDPVLRAISIGKISSLSYF